MLKSLPGIESLTDYRFKSGQNPLLELPLAIKPTVLLTYDLLHRCWSRFRAKNL